MHTLTRPKNTISVIKILTTVSLLSLAASAHGSSFIQVANETEAAVKSAIGTLNSLTEDACTIYFPAGKYTITTMAGPDAINPTQVTNLVLVGDGPATVIEFVGTGAQDRFRVTSSVNLTVKDISFLVTSTSNGGRCFEFKNAASSLSFLDCDFMFEGSGSIKTYPFTMDYDINSISIKRCNFKGMELNMKGSPGIVLSDNYLEDTTFQIQSNSGSLTGILIHGNIFNGVYGSDTAIDIDTAMSDVTITENQIIGAWSGAGTGIDITGDVVTENILIKNNIIANEGDGLDPVTYYNSTGITLSTSSTATVKRISIIGNIIEKHGTTGVEFSGAAESLIFTENHIMNSAGVVLDAAGDINAIVSTNYFANNSDIGLSLESSAGNLNTQVNANRFIIPDTAASHGVRVYHSQGTAIVTTYLFQNAFTYDAFVDAAITHDSAGTASVVSRIFDNVFEGDAGDREHPAAGSYGTFDIQWRDIDTTLN